MPDSALPAELLKIARECQKLVAPMTSVELDDWYEKHVGRRLLDEDEELWEEPLQHQALVAGMMFYHRLPHGLDTPGAEDVERELFEAIIERKEL